MSALAPAAGAGDCQALAAWLASRRHPLIVTHLRPDGDAFGSVYAMHNLLRDNGMSACRWLVEAPPPRYARLFENGAFPPPAPPTPATPADGVIALDCARADRLELPPGMRVADRPWPLVNLDHHQDNPGYGDLNLIDGTACSTAEILFRLARALDWRVSPATATALLVGAVTDTGCFRFTNTSPASFRLAADLVEAGADYAAAMDSLYFQEPFGRLRLGAALVENACFAYDGRLIYSVLTPEMTAGFGVRPAETEDLIDALRCVHGVEIACLIQPEPACTRFSFRSRSPALSVAEIAKRLGGGGHHAAAGARIPAVPVVEAERILIELTAKVFAA